MADRITCGQRGCCSGLTPSTPTACKFCGNREDCINHPGDEALAEGASGHPYSPVDPNPAITAKLFGTNGHAEPAPPRTVAEQVRDLERIIERVREAVGTDMVLVGCEEHEARIGELTTALREVLAQFVHDTHPGRRCKQTGHVNVETIDRWQAVLNGEGK